METVGELKRFFPSSKAEAGACISNATQVASIYALLGEADSAFSWLERAFEERCPFVNGLEHNYLRWVFEGLHADPRFQDLVRRVRSNR
jgi:hypothetical protein